MLIDRTMYGLSLVACRDLSDPRPNLLVPDHHSPPKEGQGEKSSQHE